MAEIKVMEGAKWHGFAENNPRKLWSVKDTLRNAFALSFLQGENPYARFEAPLDLSWIAIKRLDISKNHIVNLLKHQPRMAAHLYQRRTAILAAEMGTSKTLSCILSIEHAFWKMESGAGEVWYVAPNAALEATKREFKRWNCKVPTRFFTYEGIVKEVKNWHAGRQAPFYVVFDESSKIKNYDTARTQSCYHLANSVRKDWGDNCWINLMTGSPAPKSPLDWWAQSEVAQPGFLREGDIHKFKNRLAIITQKESSAGGVYPELVCWRDRDGICDRCGCGKDGHDAEILAKGIETHFFVPATNEIAKLYRRLQGLTLIIFKKDCLDLPEKQYRVIRCPPDSRTQRAAKMLIKSSPTVIEGLTRVRELSDGFQYGEEKSGEKQCEGCLGRCEITNHDPETYSDSPTIPCPNCEGKGKVESVRRTIKSVKCPKDDVLRELLDTYDDVGRVVIFGGFEGSIERCAAICRSESWHVIQLNAGKVQIWSPEGALLPIKDFLSMFQDQLNEYPKVAFVGHPASAGMGITLTASPVIIYFSNDFNAESRIQSEDRIHRTGMDVNRGATIIDIVHLDSDLKVLENLKRKRELQALTLNDLESTDTTLDVETR